MTDTSPDRIPDEDEEQPPKTPPAPVTGDEGARAAGSAEDDVTDPEGGLEHDE